MAILEENRVIRYQLKEYNFNMKTNNRGFVLLLPAIMISIVALVGGTVATAQVALPDSPLYGIKTATEKVRLSIAFDDEKKAKTHLSIAKEKLNEIEWLLLKEGRSDLVEVAEVSFEENQLKARKYIDEEKDTSAAARLNQKLEENGIRNINVLQNVYAKVPAEAQPAIQRVIDRAIERSEDRFGSTTPTSKNSNVTSTGEDRHPYLTSDQEKILQSLGINPESLPKKLTPEMEACLINTLGSKRIEEIKSGTVPTVSDLVKARSCI
jgi:hypothetical protein